MYLCRMEKKVIALIRTSTVQQEVDSQKEEVLDMVKADGYSIVVQYVPGTCIETLCA